MQRFSERIPCDAEFPSRYILDEARFPGGRESIRNKEEENHEPTADFT